MTALVIGAFAYPFSGATAVLIGLPR